MKFINGYLKNCIHSLDNKNREYKESNLILNIPAKNLVT